jgi:hypothetical protein
MTGQLFYIGVFEESDGIGGGLMAFTLEPWNEQSHELLVTTQMNLQISG